MSARPKCVVCDSPLPNPYSGGPACGGVLCNRFEATEAEKLTVVRSDPLPKRKAA